VNRPTAFQREGMLYRMPRSACPQRAEGCHPSALQKFPVTAAGRQVRSEICCGPRVRRLPRHEFAEGNATPPQTRTSESVESAFSQHRRQCFSRCRARHASATPHAKTVCWRERQRRRAQGVARRRQALPAVRAAGAPRREGRQAQAGRCALRAAPGAFPRAVPPLLLRCSHASSAAHARRAGEDVPPVMNGREGGGRRQAGEKQA